MSESINIYKGKVWYRKGIWKTDTSGGKFVDFDNTSNDSWDYSFESVVAKTVHQLVFILGKMIQEEKGLDYPVFIDWKSDLDVVITGSVPSRSERFDNLVQKIK